MCKKNFFLDISKYRGFIYYLVYDVFIVIVWYEVDVWINFFSSYLDDLEVSYI